MESIEKLYEEISAECRVPQIVSRTFAIFVFNHNISRALVLPTLVYGPDSDGDWEFSDNLFLHQAAIIQVLTSLESYYQIVFTRIAELLKTSEVDATALSRFIKGNKLLTEFTNALEKQKTIDFHICEILPKFYPLQEKEKIKLAMALINVNPIGTFDQEWARTFGDNENSTVTLRHKFVHSGAFHSSWQPNRKEIRDRIKDAIVLANQVDQEIVAKYNTPKFSKLIFPK